MITGGCVKNFDDVINYYTSTHSLRRMLGEIEVNKLEHPLSTIRDMERGVKFLEQAKSGGPYERIHQKSHPHTICSNVLIKLGKINTSEKSGDTSAQVAELVSEYMSKLSLLQKLIESDELTSASKQDVTELKDLFGTIADHELARMQARSQCF